MNVTSIRIYNRSGQHRVFGLVGFEIAMLEPPSEGARLLFVIAGIQRLFDVASLQDAREGSSRSSLHLVVHLNTFVIANGPQSLEIFLWDSDEQSPGRRIAAYDLVVDNFGRLYELVRDVLIRDGRDALLPAMVDSQQFGDHEAREIRPWFDQVRPTRAARVSGSIESRASRLGSSRSATGHGSSRPAADTNEAIEKLATSGYCVLPELVPAEVCDLLVEQAKQFVREEGARQRYEWGTSQRVMDTHHLSAGRKVWMHEPILRFLRTWFRDDPVACQTLFYFFGSQQSAHQDTIHLTPYPAGYMCGVWVALEDVESGSGELFVYPGSHTLPRLRSAELSLPKVATNYQSFREFDEAVANLAATARIESVPYLARKGTILVWHENLIHGGAKRINLSRSRYSIVSHYFARGSIAYYDARGEAANLVEVMGRKSDANE